MLMRLITVVIGVVIITAGITATLSTVGAGWFDKSSQTKNEEVQEAIMERAQDVAPVYKPRNFLSRKAINKWTERMDNPDKQWYVYLITESGAFIGYHVCNSVPLSYGVSITSPEREEHTTGGSIAMPAPGTDGVYYGNVDEDVHFCFDAETDAMVVFDSNFVYYDKPLNIDAPELNLNVNE